jgi:hypothetical protein
MKIAIVEEQMKIVVVGYMIDHIVVFVDLY